MNEKCNRCCSEKPAAPMLCNATWLKLAERHEKLCAECAFDRAKERRVNLTFEDLLPCAFNLVGPWFDLFRNVLAVDRNGLTLREAPEGGIYGSDEIDWLAGEQYLKVYQADDDFPVEIFICFGSDNSADLKEIIGPQGPNSLGAAKVRSIFRLLHRAFPNVETLGGFRSTGVRWNRPEKLKFNLHRLAGYNKGALIDDERPRGSTADARTREKNRTTENVF